MDGWESRADGYNALRVQNSMYRRKQGSKAVLYGARAVLEGTKAVLEGAENRYWNESKCYWKESKRYDDRNYQVLCLHEWGNPMEGIGGGRPPND